MKLFIKDLVTDELFSIDCSPMDSIKNIKYQITMDRSLPYSSDDLILYLYVPPAELAFYDYTLHEYSEECHADKPIHNGILSQYPIHDRDTLMLLYPFH